MWKPDPQCGGFRRCLGHEGEPPAPVAQGEDQGPDPKAGLPPDTTRPAP